MTPGQKLVCFLPFVLTMLESLIVGCILASAGHCTSRENYELVTLNHFRDKKIFYDGDWHPEVWNYHKPNVSLILDRDDAEDWYLPGAIDIRYSGYRYWDRQFVYQAIHPTYNCTRYDWLTGEPYNYTCTNKNVTIDEIITDVIPDLYNYTSRSFNTSLEHYWVNISGVYSDILNAENPDKENITLAELKIPDMSTKVQTKLDIPLWKEPLLPCILAFVLIPYGIFGCLKADVAQPRMLGFLLVYLVYLQVCIVAFVVVFDVVDPFEVAKAISTEFVKLGVDTTRRSGGTFSERGFAALFFAGAGLVVVILCCFAVIIAVDDHFIRTRNN